MAGSILSGTLALFGDEMYSATDLNRRAGAVLDSARNGPVTISRNHEQFALLRREDAADLVNAITALSHALELLQDAVAAADKKPVSSQFAWLSAFDAGDLKQLIHEVLSEANQAIAGGRTWRQVADLVHVWRESALVSISGVIDDALKSEQDEVPLTDPHQFLKEQESQPESIHGGA